MMMVTMMMMQIIFILCPWFGFSEDFQEKKTFKNLQVIPTLKKNMQNYLVEMYFYKLKL